MYPRHIRGRLSFSIKRKDREIQHAKPENALVIEDSPEKPPPKKICRTSVAESDVSVAVKRCSDSGTNPTQGRTQENNNNSNDGDKHVEEAEASNGNETEGGPVISDANSQEPADPTGTVESRLEGNTEKQEENADNNENDEDDVEVMDVSLAESSILESTIESVADDSENNEKSDPNTPTAPKRARLSKTEAAWQRLKQQKDKELRQKEKDERLKLRQEERERREQERKELRDKKEKERLEKEKKKEEERLERERKKEEERQAKERERIEREKKKEEERQLREKERIEKEKEKEEKEKLRREKEDEKRRREEDKKRELEEESAKKEKAKQAFRSFFVKKTCAPNPEDKDSVAPREDGMKEDEGSRGESAGPIKFRPFQLKKDMKLAPIVSEDAKNRFVKSALEARLKEQNASVASLYIKQLSGGYKPLKSSKRSKTDNQEPEDQDVIVITRSNRDVDESCGGRMRAKLLQFAENYRPAYYGTWRKRCPQINGRRPFSKYCDFDYAVDSDDEWEEGEGESLAGTDDEKEEKDEVEEEYEEDDFLVPHGYLSESEEDEEDDQPMDPEALKARIAARQEEFKADRKAGLQKKKIVAVCSLGPDGVALQEEIKVLSQFKAVLMVANGLAPSWERESEVVINSKDAEPAVLTGKALELFCKTAHGFQGGVRALYDTFFQKWKSVSDVRVTSKSLKMTLTNCCKRSKSLNAMVVNRQLLEKFGLEPLEEDTGNDATPTLSKFLPNDVIPELIKVTQGNSKTSQILDDFLTLMAHRKFGKAQVKRTLTTIGEYDSVQRCWLVKDECLKEHGLENLKIEKATKKDVKEEKSNKAKEGNKSKDERKSKQPDEDQKNSNKENDDSKDSTKLPPADAPCKTEETSNLTPEATTPRRVSIKSFFTPKSKISTTPTSSRGQSSATPKILTSTKDSSSNRDESNAPTPMAVGVSTAEVPKAKKRVQLTTLSRTPTLKEEKKTQAVLDKDELILIEDSN
ncbi:chromatin assembly factor 1 subunit A [Galendromus occidentalis]|uniref:Chromatin assembly factor 1 subunit A n=1 Tax=Galendromus occidentalis TaxID=34638 RepID=A0AAJ7L4U9_9ACAR|nr:chromatin assembly factor 1 subunit A [Galendromus occidentalis]